MNWLLVQLGATCIMAFNGILDKKLSGRLEAHPLLYVGAFGVVALPVASLGVIGLVPRPALPDLMLALVGGTCFALAVALYYRAVALDEISRLVPLFRLSSLMVLLFSALLFGERLRPTEYMAFAVMLAGSILLALKLDQGRPRLSRGAGLMAIVATLLGINSTLIAQVYYRYPLRAAFVAEQAGVAVGAVILLILAPRKRVLWQRVRSMRHSMQAVLVGQQTVRLGTSYLSAYVLIQVGSAALVSVMSGLRPFFVLILASWLLDETVDRRNLAPKLAGLGCMSVGMLLLVA